MMFQNSIQELRSGLFEFIKTKYDTNNILTIDTCTGLLDRGLMDSFSLVELINHIEQTYQLKIRRRELTKENFNSLDSLVNFVFSVMD